MFCAVLIAGCCITGVLADDPGLGKTVTMLALIAHTAGTLPRTPREFYNPAQLEREWAGARCNPQVRASNHHSSKRLHFTGPMRAVVWHPARPNGPARAGEPVA